MVEQNISYLEVYINIPPENSKYYNPKLFEDLELEVTSSSQCVNDLSICLCGDLSARTSEICDYISEDNNPLDQDNGELFNSETKSLPPRSNKDKKVNNSGTGLITLCETTSLFIANGRMKSDIQGELTFKDKSCIDYFLLSNDMYPLVTHFNVQTFDPLLSDGHSAVELTLSTPNIWKVNGINENEFSNENGDIGQFKVRWAPNKKGDYILQLNNNAGFEEVIKELDKLTETVNVDSSNINNVTNQLTEVLINGAKNCGMVTQTNPHSKQKPRKKTLEIV